MAVAESRHLTAATWHRLMDGVIRLEIHDDAGPAMHWEDPERVAAEIAAFAGERTPVTA